MKKKCLIVFVAVLAMMVGLGTLALAQSGVVAQVNGNTVVQDPANDLLLRDCIHNYPDIACSLPPGEVLDLPAYFDIKTAKITQIGRGRVDLSIALYEPIPAEPSYPFVSYIWQFQGGCVGTPPKTGNKAAISIVWHGATKTWTANWYVISNCNPRQITEAESIADWNFTTDGVMVRVALDDLLEATDDGKTLVWHAAVRRLPFVYTLSDGTEITHTVAVDYAPDVVELSDTPPYYVTNHPEEEATWVPR
jgi:hypothetical protein